MKRRNASVHICVHAEIRILTLNLYRFHEKVTQGDKVQTIKGENKSFTVDDTRRERIFTVQEHCVSLSLFLSLHVTSFLLIKYTTLRVHAFAVRSSTCALPFSPVYFIARNIRFHGTSCKHGRHLRPGISDDICSFFMSLWHPFRENFFLPSRAELFPEPVYVLRSRPSGFAREIINIRSYVSSHTQLRGK